MGFRSGAIAKIWTVENKQKCAICSISVSQKNKQTGQYEKTFSSNQVVFCGNAFAQRPLAGQRIKIGDCDVTNALYIKPDGTKTYPVKYIVWSYEVVGENGENQQQTAINLEELEGIDCPF